MSGKLLKIRNFLKANPVIRNLARIGRTKYFGDLGWSKISDNVQNMSELEGEKHNVLIATSFGGEIAMTSVESLIAAALKVRGAKIHVFLCDGINACQLCDTTRFFDTNDFIKNGFPKYVCRSCYKSGAEIYSKLNVVVHKFNSYLNTRDYEYANNIAWTINHQKIKDLRIDDVPVGEHAIAGACRYFAKADFSDEPMGGEVLRKYLHSAILVLRATQELFRQIDVTCTVLNHGIYVPQGIISEVARSKGKRVVTWNTAYRKQCFIFSHNDTYHHELMHEPNSNWENIDFDQITEEKISSYIDSRSVGEHDWISFNNEPRSDDDKTRENLCIDNDKVIVTLFTNVMWDAQLHYPSNIYNNMLEWIIDTIDYFKRRTDIILVVRVHPAELSGHLVSRQLVTDIITKRFGDDLTNIRVIGPEDHQNSYSLALISDSVIIYGSKIGVELSAMGIPVILVGEAWLRNKDIAVDINSKLEYFSKLDAIPQGLRLKGEQLERAKKYAYHFFFRRMIPLKNISPTGTIPKYTLSINAAKDLKPGNCKGLDVICDGILYGDEFIYDT